MLTLPLYASVKIFNRQIFFNCFYLSIIENHALSASWSFFASQTAFLLSGYGCVGTWNIDLNNKIKVILKTKAKHWNDIIDQNPQKFRKQLFLLISQKKFARETRFFVFPLLLFCTTTTLFCTAFLPMVLPARFARESSAIIGETSSPLLLLVWVARTKLNSKQIWNVFHHCRRFLGIVLGKETNNTT